MKNKFVGLWFVCFISSLFISLFGFVGVFWVCGTLVFLGKIEFLQV